MAYPFDVRDGQRLLAALDFYTGAIDGDVGPLTRAALDTAEETFHHHRFPDERRRLIAASQAILNQLGFEAGAVDGLMGPNTHEALTDWASRMAGTDADVVRTVRTSQPATADAWPTQADVSHVFGPPGGHDCAAGRCQLPFAFQIAWDRDQRVQSFACHVKVAQTLTDIFAEAAQHYGRDDFERLELHLFGGCYNKRRMRGGTRWSMHSWGIAVDLNPEKNQLRWGRDRAQFALPAYDPWWAIVEAHGGVSLGRVANMDWMHFQFARL